jgi:hypothetical protein
MLSNTGTHFSLIHSAHTDSEAQLISNPIDTEEAKRRKDAADHLPTSNVEVQNEWSHTYASPYVFIA